MSFLARYRCFLFMIFFCCLFSAGSKIVRQNVWIIGDAQLVAFYYSTSSVAVRNCKRRNISRVPILVSLCPLLQQLTLCSSNSFNNLELMAPNLKCLRCEGLFRSISGRMPHVAKVCNALYFSSFERIQEFVTM